MSIASNVILENTRLANTRTKIRNKLTEYNIWWDNSLTIFELVERLVLMFGLTITDKTESNIVPPEGFEYSVTLEDANVPVDWWIDGIHRVVRTDSNGKSSVNVEYVKDATGTVICNVGKKEAIHIDYSCVPFENFIDYAWDYNLEAYDIVKYPTDISHTFNVDEVNYSEVYNLSKDTVAGSVVMAIPKVYSNGIGATNGIHIGATIYQKKDSNQDGEMQ